MDAERFAPLPEIDETFEPLSAAAAGVLLAMALATMRFSKEPGAKHAPDRTRPGGQ